MTTETKHLTFEVKFAAGADASGAFEGLAAGYGNIDHGGDVIAPGAFAASLAEHKAAGTKPALLWQHDQSQPIGVIDDLQETAAGLAIKGRLADTPKGNEARMLAKMGALQGLSVGYQTKSAARDSKGVRTIKSAYLGEVSFVAVPMNNKARVTSIKGKTMENDNTDTGEVAELKSKIEALEEKGAKVDDLEKKFADAVKRADNLELKMNRPGAFQTKDEAKNIEKKAFNSFLRHGQQGLADNERKALGLESKSLTIGSPDTSIWAPPEFAKDIVRNLILYSPIRSVARVTQIGASEIRIPRRTANLTASWVAETAPRTAGNPTYDNVTIAPFELATYVDASNQLIEDSAYDIASEIAMDLGEEFGRAEGAAFVSGDGVTQPQGILTEATIAQMHAGSTTAITADNIMQLFHLLPSPYAANAVWLMNRSTIGAIRLLKTTIGSYLWQDGLQPGNPPTLLGRPVVECPDMPNISAGLVPIVFGDVFSGYRIVDRINLAMLRDPYTQATAGTTRFHARRRVGGRVVKPEAFKELLMAV